MDPPTSQSKHPADLITPPSLLQIWVISAMYELHTAVLFAISNPHSSTPFYPRKISHCVLLVKILPGNVMHSTPGLCLVCIIVYLGATNSVTAVAMAERADEVVDACRRNGDACETKNRSSRGRRCFCGTGGGQWLFGTDVSLQYLLVPSVTGGAGVPPQSQSARREESAGKLQTGGVTWVSPGVVIRGLTIRIRQA